MFHKITNSWNLAKECWRVLTLDKEMLMFPILSTVATIVAMMLVGIPLWGAGVFEHFTAHRSNSGDIDLYNVTNGSLLITMAIITIVPTFISYIVMTFFNTGLITCAFIRLCGEDPVLSDGFNVAWKRLPQIVGWACISASVGLLLQMVKNKNGFLGSIVSNLLGLGWRVGTYFTVPVIVAEEKGAIESIKRSGELVKKNWGEALTLEVGFSFIAGIIMMIPIGLSAFAVMTFGVSPAIGGMIFATALVSGLAIAVVFSTLDAIAKAALYIYACGDALPVGFSEELLDNMFKHKNASGPANA